MGHVAATFDQRAYRFRNDDGSETGATWKALQNTPISQEVGQPFRLRMAIQETAGGGANNQTIVLQANVGGAGWFDVGTATGGVRLAVSPHFSNNVPTTKQLTGTTGTFLPGVLQDSSNQTNISFVGSENTELEWAQLIVLGVTHGTTVQFRVTINGAVANTTTVTPTVTATVTSPQVAPTLTLSSQGATSATLAWSSVAGATSYELQRDLVNRYVGANLSFVDSPLTPGVNYTYRVRAVNSGGAGPWSSNLVVKIPLLATSDVTGGGQAEATGAKRALRASTVTGGGDPTVTAKKDTGATAPVTGGGDVATQGREEHSIASAVSGGGSTTTVGFSPQPPTNFTVVPEGEGMRLDWDANPGTFVVERERWYHDDSVPV